MKIITLLNQFNIDFVLFCDPIKNNIIYESNFIKIIYSSPLFSTNGIYLSFNYIYNLYDNYKYSFEISYNNDIIKQIQFIEKSILNKINIINKTQQYKIYERIKTGNQLFINKNHSIFFHHNNYSLNNNISQNEDINKDELNNEISINNISKNNEICKNIKYNKDNEIKFIEHIYLLKITGIWETKYKYGLNYKFILCNKYNLINQ